MELIWDTRPEDMVASLTIKHIELVKQKLIEIAERRAPEITKWMQANRPWTDRTFEAKSTLHTEVEVKDELVTLLLNHGIDYGWYLEGFDPRSGTLRETMQGGKYSVLLPALDHWGQILMDDIRQAMSE